MALDAKTSLAQPIQIDQAAGSSSSRALLIGAGDPDGNTDPYQSAAKGSMYICTDGKDDYPTLWLKVDEDGSDDDWVTVLCDYSQQDHYLDAPLQMQTDAAVQFRSSDIRIYSDSASKLYITAPSGVDIERASVGSGTYMENVLAGSGTITYGALGASVASTACLAVTGLTQQHYCYFSPSTMSGCLIPSGFCCSPGGGLLQLTVTATSSYAGGNVVFSYWAVQACGL